jgi:hypothetical protein
MTVLEPMMLMRSENRSFSYNAPLAMGGSIARWGAVRGVGAATPEAPHRNLMSAPWWTDGNRLVVELSAEPVPLERQGFFYWD